MSSDNYGGKDLAMVSGTPEVSPTKRVNMDH